MGRGALALWANTECSAEVTRCTNLWH